MTLINNPSETTPFPFNAPDKGQAYNRFDPSVYPYTYNLKIITYDTSSNATQIDFYSGAGSFTDTGSLEFSHYLEYSGSNVTHILIKKA